MASKNDKGAEEAEKGQSPAQGKKGDEEGAGSEPSDKKRKLKLILGLAGISLTATAIGGYFVVKTVGSKPTELAAKAPDGEQGAAAPGQAQPGPTGPQAGTAKDSGQAAPASAGVEKDTKSSQGAAQGSNAAAAGAPQGALGKEPSSGDKANDQFGDTVDIPKMELNLGNPLENRFLRFGLSLEYHGGEEQKKELTRRMPQIRDVVISIISRKTRIELLSADGKEGFRKQLKNTLNELLQEPVTNVYFTEFLVE